MESPDVSVKARVKKVAKMQPPCDAESDEESESKFLANFDDSCVSNILRVMLQVHMVTFLSLNALMQTCFQPLYGS